MFPTSNLPLGKVWQPFLPSQDLEGKHLQGGLEELGHLLHLLCNHLALLQVGSLFCCKISYLVHRWLICQNEGIQQAFEKFCIFCDKYEHLFPLHFILGFYVTQVFLPLQEKHQYHGKVIARWWLQFDAIVWPDKLAMDLVAFLPDAGKPRQVKHAMILTCLCR